MSDLISREEVLKIVKNKLVEYFNLSLNGEEYGEGGADACEEIEEEIKKLPSQNECKPLPQPPLLDK